MPQTSTLLLVSLLLASVVHAQSVTFERLETPSNLIIDIIQDQDGFLWMGGFGLHKYDGYSFESFFHDPKDSTSLISNNISQLHVDSDGDLWAITGGLEGVLHRFDPETKAFTRFTDHMDQTKPFFSGSKSHFYEDQNGFLWIGGHDKLLRFDRHTENFTAYNLPYDSLEVSVVLESRSGTFWVGMHSWDLIGDKGGLYTFNRTTGEFIRREVSILRDSGAVQVNALSALYEDKDSTLWIGAESQELVRFDPKSGASKTFSNPHAEAEYPRMPIIRDILEDRLGNIWVAYSGIGVNRFDRNNESFTRYQNTEGHKREFGFDIANSVKLFEDRQGTLWASYDGDLIQAAGAVYKVIREPGTFSYFTHDPNDPSSLSDHRHIYAFHEEPEDNIWVLTFGGGLNYFDTETRQFTRLPYNPKDTTSLTALGLNGVIEDGIGRVWVVGFDTPVHIYDPETNQFSHTRNGLSKINEIIQGGAIDIFEDQFGIIWIGTFWDGLIQYNPESGDVIQYRHNLEDSTSLAGDVVYEISEDRYGNLWIGSFGQRGNDRKGAMHRFDRNTGSFERHEKFDAASLYQDEAGNSWILTISRGLILWDQEDDTYKQYSVGEGLPNNSIMCMLEDSRGKLWFSSRAGLSRLDPITEVVFHFVDAGDPEKVGFSEGSNACFEGSDGTFYFGRFPGMTVFHPDKFEFNELPPEVAITNLFVRGDSLLSDDWISYEDKSLFSQSITLDYGQNDFSISYLGLHYEDPQRNTYKYILEGLNEEWIQAGTERQARFFQVPPGEYLFRVKAANPNGYWSQEEASISITVNPPWWRTTWAYIFYGAFLTANIMLINRVQRQRLIRQERERANIKMAQLEAEAAVERALLAERLEEVKSRFFVNLSHELRTPLTLILGPVQDALQGVYGAIETPLRGQLGLIKRNGDRLLDLINQLLDIERLEADGMHLQASKQDLIAFVRALTLSFVPRAEREGKFIAFEALESELHLYFDAGKLEKILYNLLSNAFKFTPEKAEIHVSVTNNETNASIKVEDTGTGIPADEIPHVFDRFYQVDDSATRQYEGSGIGLALVKELVELHKGSIEVQSKEGSGSSFKVFLPFGRSHLKATEVVLNAESAGIGGVRSTSELEETSFDNSEAVTVEGNESEQEGVILIVEDNDDVREYLKLHLKGFEIVEALDGEEGLTKAIELVPDLIISDIMMPKMDGYALCEALRKEERTRDIPIIMLTAKATEENKIEGLASGADDYLYKPFSARELLVRTKNLLYIRRSLKAQYRSQIVLKPTNIAVSPADVVFIEKVRSLVENHLEDSRLSVSWLAEEVGLSRRQLQRRMNAVMHTSASTFIANMRLERALQLLTQRAGNVSEVAYKVGYNDPRHFSILFKRQFGYPPSDLLKED